MKVKCILSHEHPAGVVFRAGEIYELDEWEGRFFVPVEKEEKTKEKEVKKGAKK